MAILAMEGFEFGTEQTVVRRSGLKAYRCNPTGANIDSRTIDGCNASTGVPGQAFQVGTLYLRFYFRVDQRAMSGAEEVMEVLVKSTDQSSQTSSFIIQMSPTGRLVTPGGTGTAVIEIGDWNRIELKCVVNGTSELRVNGATDRIWTDTSGVLYTNIANFILGKANNVTGQTVDYYFDDVVVRDDTWPGDGKIALLLPSGNGTYTGWTAGAVGNTGDYQDVKEQPNDGDTTYVKSSTNTTRESDLCVVAGDDVFSGTVNGVGASSWTKDTGTTAAHALFLRSGSTDTTRTALDGGTAYSRRSMFLSTDPATSAAWTWAAALTAQPGIQHLQSQSREVRCTALALLVDYTPEVAASRGRRNDLQSDWVGTRSRLQQKS